MASPDPKHSKLLARIERLERLLRANPLRNTSVERGRVRMYGSSELLIDGLLSVVGQLVGSGEMTWTGSIDQSGPTNLRGPVAITGENGTLDVSAETLLRGLTRILADLQVESGGRIKVGGITLTPLGGGRIEVGTGSSAIVIDSATGTIDFAAGGQLKSDGALTWLVQGNNGFAIDSTQLIARFGLNQVRVTNSGIQLQGVPDRTGTGLPVGALGIDPDGTVWRAA